jgi:hypothetical protein
MPQSALKKIEGNKDSLGAIVDGWVITKGLGTYDTNYLKRAVVAAFGWPANQHSTRCILTPRSMLPHRS